MSIKLLKYTAIIPLTGLILFALLWLFDGIVSKPSDKIDYGVTFSYLYSKELGLNPSEVYTSILDDLKVKKIRIPIYWPTVEKEKDNFDFSIYDKFANEAAKKDVKIIFVTGFRVPRWPECFQPDWAKSLTETERHQRILNLVEKTITHFKNHPEIIAWQVENEPLLDWGICKPMNEKFLQTEANLARSLSQKPVILTDSGEWGLWVAALKYSNIFGSSLYRTVWNPFFGYFNYPLPPLYYRLKAFVTQKLFAPHSQGIFISEMQTEPWLAGKNIISTPIEEQIKVFSVKNLEEVIHFTSKTGIDTQYFWGVEWWYFMKNNGHPEYWNYIKGIMN